MLASNQSKVRAQHVAPMAGSKSYSTWRIVVALLLLLTYVAVGASAEKMPPTESKSFDEKYHVTWSPNKVRHLSDGSVALTLDQQGGSGYSSRNLYTFGYVSTAIKLVAGDSSGVVTAYYLSSNISKSDHDELDFEFLGNKSGLPYVLQTNVFANGIGGREQRIYLWFDPTAAFHNYSVLWNKAIIIFSVDEVPIRIFKNNGNLGVGYLQSRPMGIYSTIWNGQKWATRGGLDKIDWTLAPFVASFKTFIIDACENSIAHSWPCALSSKWWAQSQYQSLDGNLQTQLKMVKRYYMMYDYCTDYKRNPVSPPECATN